VLADGLKELCDHDHDVERLPTHSNTAARVEPASRESQPKIKKEEHARHIQKHNEHQSVADATWGAMQAEACTIRCILHFPHYKHGIQNHHYSPRKLKLGAPHEPWYEVTRYSSKGEPVAHL
jgi:hypothetical protein